MQYGNSYNNLNSASLRRNAPEVTDMPGYERQRWCLLIHTLPARPLYFRARIRRLLAEAGAAPIKKSVYALPHTDAGHERLKAIAA